MTSLTVLNHEIHQVDNLYSLNDLHKASGGQDKHRPAFFVRNQEVKELANEIMQCANLHSDQVIRKVNGGHNRGTYACKEIVYRYAMWISPKFALAVIRVFDAFITGKITPAERQTISIEQQKAIRTAIAKRCQQTSAHYQTVYTALYEHFNIPRYSELLAKDFDEALRFIHSVKLAPVVEQIHFNSDFAKSMLLLGRAKVDDNKAAISVLEKAMVALDYALETIKRNNATQYSVFENLNYQLTKQ